MDPRIRGFSGSNFGIRVANQSLPVLQNQKVENGLFDQSGEFNLIPATNTTRASAPTPSSSSILATNTTRTSAPTPSSSSILAQEEPSPEDCDFSDAVLGYINQILMEEDVEDKTCMLQDSLDLQVAERSFYDVIGEKYPPPRFGNPGLATNAFVRAADNELCENIGSCVGNDGDLSCIVRNLGEVPRRNLQGNTVSHSSYSSTNSVISSVEGPLDSPNSILQEPALSSESQSILQFQKGVEEASKFLPAGMEFFGNLNLANLLRIKPNLGTNNSLSVKVENDEEEPFVAGSKVRKNSHREEQGNDEEGNRSSKQAAVYLEPTLRSDMFDIFLLHSTGDGKKHYMARRDALQNKNDKIVLSNGKSRASKSGKGHGKKQNSRKEVVDLRTLLVLCAQSVAADDFKSAHEFLRLIRQHSTPYGDGNQRLAHIFADGLEARLAGTGSQIYKGLVGKRTSAADVLKAYHLFLAACPFRKISNFVSNIKIRRSSENSMRIHVIDFGILYGFQWPTFIQRLSWRSGGPPKLRITGIDFPQPGFRPAERIIETGQRLAAYAESFNVPFEYNAIAKKWETIQLEELKIDRDEYLVVTCFYRGKNLLDESVVVDSPRNKFLSLIRKMNPDIFIHGLINGAFNAPFFVTRFREALFHYSSLFDMLESIVPREDWERMLIEKEIFGREALNVIACEGCERVERPETYKQWQVRILRAGFSQQSFDRTILDRAMEKVRSSFHKDFLIDEDGQWLLQGWKGRIIYALSCWKPA